MSFQSGRNPSRPNANAGATLPMAHIFDGKLITDSSHARGSR
jgi:hypothetical protein